MFYVPHYAGSQEETGWVGSRFDEVNAKSDENLEEGSGDRKTGGMAISVRAEM